MEPSARAGAPGITAIVLAGGTARRLGGVDKLALDVGGRSLLDRVLTPLAELGWPAVVVGPHRPVAPGLPEPSWVREDPPGGGPAAALAAGVAALGPLTPGPAPAPALVAVLAGDLPHLTGDALGALADAAARVVATGGAGAVAVDDRGVDQLLLGVWSTARLRGATTGVAAGGSVRSVVAPLAPLRVSLPGDPPPWSDCDTAADLAAARLVAAS